MTHYGRDIRQIEIWLHMKDTRGPTTEQVRYKRNIVYKSKEHAKLLHESIRGKLTGKSINLY